MTVIALGDRLRELEKELLRDTWPRDLRTKSNVVECLRLVLGMAMDGDGVSWPRVEEALTAHRRHFESTDVRRAVFDLLLLACSTLTGDLRSRSQELNAVGPMVAVRSAYATLIKEQAVDLAAALTPWVVVLARRQGMDLTTVKEALTPFQALNSDGLLGLAYLRLFHLRAKPRTVGESFSLPPELPIAEIFKDLSAHDLKRGSFISTRATCAILANWWKISLESALTQLWNWANQDAVCERLLRNELGLAAPPAMTGWETKQSWDQLERLYGSGDGAADKLHHTWRLTGQILDLDTMVLPDSTAQEAAAGERSDRQGSTSETGEKPKTQAQNPENEKPNTPKRPSHPIIPCMLFGQTGIGKSAFIYSVGARMANAAPHYGVKFLPETSMHDYLDRYADPWEKGKHTATTKEIWCEVIAAPQGEIAPTQDYPRIALVDYKGEKMTPTTWDDRGRAHTLLVGSRALIFFIPAGALLGAEKVRSEVTAIDGWYANVLRQFRSSSRFHQHAPIALVVNRCDELLSTPDEVAKFYGSRPTLIPDEFQPWRLHVNRDRSPRIPKDEREPGISAFLDDLEEMPRTPRERLLDVVLSDKSNTQNSTRARLVHAVFSALPQFIEEALATSYSFQMTVACSVKNDRQAPTGQLETLGWIGEALLASYSSSDACARVRSEFTRDTERAAAVKKLQTAASKAIKQLDQDIADLQARFHELGERRRAAGVARAERTRLSSELATVTQSIEDIERQLSHSTEAEKKKKAKDQAALFKRKAKVESEIARLKVDALAAAEADSARLFNALEDRFSARYQRLVVREGAGGLLNAMRRLRDHMNGSPRHEIHRMLIRHELLGISLVGS